MTEVMTKQKYLDYMDKWFRAAEAAKDSNTKYNNLIRGETTLNAFNWAMSLVKDDRFINKNVQELVQQAGKVYYETGKYDLDLLDVEGLLKIIYRVIGGTYTESDLEELKKIINKHKKKQDQYKDTPNSTVKKTPVIKQKVSEFAHHYNSYSGADMICSIDVPGYKPIVIGELTELSYSIYRAKTPVRKLGAISASGYTRGMRMVSGILNFAVFDQGIIRKVMKEMIDMGYDILLDEMPTFNITVSMANEYGSRSKFVVYGVTITAEGFVAGINDINLQKTCQFYALDVEDLKEGF